MKKFFQTIAVTIILAGFLPTSTLLAQETQSRPVGLNIDPFIIESDVAKGASTNGFVTVTNWTTSTLQIEVKPKDFVPNYETGQPVFVPDEEINDKTYSIAQWIQILEKSKFTLKPQESRQVKYSLNPPVDAEQGSHYGALLFSYKGSSNDKNISEVTQTVGSVLLVRYGVARESGTVEIKPDKTVLLTGDVINWQSRFKNTGNVHLRPKGEIYIKNIFGKKVASLVVNRDADALLPDVQKTFESKWYPGGLAFGRYVAESSLIYGQSRLEARDRQVIWVLPIYLIIGFCILIGGFIWFALKGIHHYNAWLVKSYSGAGVISGAVADTFPEAKVKPAEVDVVASGEENFADSNENGVFADTDDKSGATGANENAVDVVASGEENFADLKAKNASSKKVSKKKAKSPDAEKKNSSIATSSKKKANSPDAEKKNASSKKVSKKK